MFYEKTCRTLYEEIVNKFVLVKIKKKIFILFRKKSLFWFKLVTVNLCMIKYQLQISDKVILKCWYSLIIYFTFYPLNNILSVYKHFDMVSLDINYSSSYNLGPPLLILMTLKIITVITVIIITTIFIPASIIWHTPLERCTTVDTRIITLRAYFNSVVSIWNRKFHI